MNQAKSAQDQALDGPANDRITNELAGALSLTLAALETSGDLTDEEVTSLIEDAGEVLERFQNQRKDEDAALLELRGLCQSAGIDVVQAQEPELTGMWDWIDRNSVEACDQSFESERQASLDALEHKFGEDWRVEVAAGNTRRSFLEFCLATIEEGVGEPA